MRTAPTSARHARARPTSAPAAFLLAMSAVLAAAVGGCSIVELAVPGLGPVEERWSPSARPALPDDVAPRPLATPQRPPAGSGGFAVIEQQDDGSRRPVRWDPCRPIHYVIRAEGSTPTGRAAVRAAITRLEQITGLRFHDDGTTTEAPVPDRPAIDRGRYGDRWSPVLIAWTTPAEFAGLAGYVGLAGPQSVGGDTPGQRRFVTGVVLLDAAHLAGLEATPTGREQVRAVIGHELGHLVGLDHVEDAGQVMHPRPGGDPVDYAAGDLRGLAALSGGPCFRDF